MSDGKSQTTADWWPSTRKEWLYWQKLVSEEHDRQTAKIERLYAIIRDYNPDDALFDHEKVGTNAGET